MFGIGMSEILMILVVVLVLFGPSKLPEIARTIGKGLREMRRASDDLRTAIMVDDIDKPAGPTQPVSRRLSKTSDSEVQDADYDDDHNEFGQKISEAVSRDEPLDEAANVENAAHSDAAKVNLEELVATAEKTAREQEEKQERELAESGDDVAKDGSGTSSGSESEKDQKA
jgi:TatA/E family protein of Tat protein translocase